MVGKITTILALAAGLWACASPSFDTLHPSRDIVTEMIDSDSSVNTKIDPKQWGIVLPERIYQVLQQSNKDSLSLFVAQQRRIIAEGDYYLTTGNTLPSVKASASTSAFQTLNSNDIRSSNNNIALGLSVSWQVDLWGKLDDLTAAAEQTARASQWDLAAANLIVHGQVLSAWLDILEQRQLLNLFDKNYSNQRQRLGMLGRRVDLGLTSATGFDNARLALMKLKRDRLQASFKLSQAKRRFNLILGRMPSTETALPLTMPELGLLTASVLNPPLLLNRPDVRAAEARLLAAGFRWQASMKNARPSLTLDANVKVREGKLSQVFDPDFWLTTVAGSLVQPIFYRQELTVERQQARARAEIAQNSFYSSLLQAWQSVENLYNNESVLAQQHDAATAAYDSASRVEISTLAQYEQGLVSSFEVFTAQRNTLNASTDLIRLSVSQLRNRINLILAIGPIEDSK